MRKGEEEKRQQREREREKEKQDNDDMANRSKYEEDQQAIVLSMGCLHGQPTAFDYCSSRNDKTSSNSDAELQNSARRDDVYN